MDMKKIAAMAEERAATASAIDTKLRNVLVDEIEKLDIDAEEQMAMAVLVALGVANVILKGLLEAIEENGGEAEEAFAATVIATNFFANEMLGPQLVRLHKMAKRVGA